MFLLHLLSLHSHSFFPCIGNGARMKFVSLGSTRGLPPRRLPRLRRLPNHRHPNSKISRRSGTPLSLRTKSLAHSQSRRCLVKPQRSQSRRRLLPWQTSHRENEVLWHPCAHLGTKGLVLRVLHILQAVNHMLRCALAHKLSWLHPASPMGKLMKSSEKNRRA